MSERLGTVYTLTDPRNGLIRYVGATTSSLPNRLAGHLSAARHGDPLRGSKRSPVATWVHELLAAGLKPLLTPLRQVDEQEMLAAEREEIERHFDEGWPLTNVKDSPAAPHMHGYERQLQAVLRRAERVTGVDDALLAEAHAEADGLRQQIAFMTMLRKQMLGMFASEPEDHEGAIRERLAFWNEEPIGVLECPPLEPDAVDALADALLALVRCGARHNVSFAAIVDGIGRDLVRERRRDRAAAA